MQVIDEKQDYKIYRVENGQYDVVPCSTQGSLPTSITSGGGEQEIYKLPSAGLCDLLNVEHTYTITPGAGVNGTGGYNMIFLNLIPLRQITFQYNGTILLNLSPAYRYSSMCGNAFMKKAEFLSQSLGYGTTTSFGIIEFSRKSNQTASGRPIIVTANLQQNWSNRSPSSTGQLTPNSDV